MRNHRSFTASLVVYAVASACSGDGGNPLPPIDTLDGGSTVSLGSGETTLDEGTGSDTGTDTGTDTSGSDGSSSSGSADSTGGEDCEGFVCNGGLCEVTDEGPVCVCPENYVLDGSDCVVDENCIKLRPLDDRCRQLVGGPPAVAVFFGVEFCTGDPVLPEKFEELELRFEAFENGTPVSENVEASQSILDKDVESYVTLVLDVSSSVSDTGNIPALVDALRTFAQELEPAEGEPAVYVSIWVFTRNVDEYLPPTRNFATIDQALADLVDEWPILQTQLGVGTALATATSKGIRETDRIRALRNLVTNEGVLTTGTVVVVTDGRENTNTAFDTQLLGSTINQVIAVGISDDVSLDELTLIGRDGSFPQSDPQAWAATFATIGQRVEGFPERSYLLAYCTTATTGEPEVEITVAGPSDELQVVPISCDFDAEAFSIDPSDVCTQEFFATECDDKQCGGFSACGGCADDQCCADTVCAAPVPGDGENVSCLGDDGRCYANDGVCLGDACVAPVGLTEACDPETTPCDPGVGLCSVDGVCEPTLPESYDSTCAGPYECSTLACYAGNQGASYCGPPAHLFDECGGNDVVAVCEAGGMCRSNVCEPWGRTGGTCGGPEDCASGECLDPAEGASTCGTPAVCFLPWDAKIVP